ncbi:proteasome-substrate-size regulator domain-containing protein [Hirsutella rhossiliensis]|uniref:Proteasome-substrate-size regulator domain-containing protein n=1 Tax=Hirsutella rhossiliensis TaxID=111463 RepID=A0A9P8MP15_9HYPO|nr:proteasome-substrate-size regulator domain-containing protein [Hirsutella rhossiliensis]KAH0958575.1 proteasome-substrate-size regulator domain-containing protein [Hirsutella rhossiliensis]
MDENIGLRHEGSHAALSASATSHLMTSFAMYEPVSRATSPGIPCSKTDEDDKKRYRQRTFAYFQQLPFEVEEEAQRDTALHGILKHLYIAIRAEDFSPGALHWTKELQAWLNLKFEMTRELRAKLAKLFYSLALAPGLDATAADRFLRMVLTLTRKNHYLKPVDDLTLDWRPLWNEIKAWVLPSEGPAHQSNRRRATKQLLKLCIHAHTYFDPRDRPAMLEELLPYFGVNELPNAFVVIGALNALLPSHPAPASEPLAQPQHFLPTLFHLWSIVNRSKVVDMFFVDLFSRLTRDHIHSDHIPFSEYGIFSKEQSDLIFTAMLRLTQIPVGQANSPYTPVDYLSGVGVYLEKDKKKYPVAYMMSRLIVSSLSPHCMEHQESTMASLEGLIESIDTFFHPSNQGSWTTLLAQFVLYLTDGFVSRWNREQSGELDIPSGRMINLALKKRFVLSLKEVTFMGLFSKSNRVSHYYYNALQGLAYLEPDLMLPGALQRFYPSLQGLVEVHRTTSSLNGLQMIANIMCKLKGYRCHITALLALALPGIDANDLNKTQYTLNFIQSVAYSVPFQPMTTPESHIHDTTLAMEWVQAEMERMERDGQNIQLNYQSELSDEDEMRILRSSTAGFGEFVLTLLGKIFTLLENLPDANQVRGGTPEDNVINALPAALSPLFASLSPEIFDMALDKIATFVSGHVVHQARDAMAWILNALCKVSPEKTLKVFVPMLVVNIRNEIDYNNAASDRTTGTDYLPRDRALVWHVSMLAMAVVHVGSQVLKYKEELLGIADYMQQKCRGLPTILVSNYIHHLLLNLTHTYPIDHALYEPDVIKRGLDIGDWGKTTAPADLTIRWHQPSPSEIEFAVELFASQVTSAAQQLELLMSDNPPVSREGKNKAWSDEVSRLMQQIRLVIAGMAIMFDPKRASGDGNGGEPDGDNVDTDGDEVTMEDESALAEDAEQEELRPQFRYKAGYLLKPGEPVYERIHELRDELGRLLTKAHAFLNAKQEDDVNCFTALCSAYRTWITDVGIERSAHPFERHLRLYKADIAAFKIKGLRKVYPRPLLIKRAEAYHILRMKHNASARHKSELDKRLLLDLAQSCLSLYADVRRVAQGAQDSSLKALIGGRPLVIPVILDGLRAAIQSNQHDRIKGGMYTLLFTSLMRSILKDWRFAPEAMRLYIETAGIDKPSIQALGSSALYAMFEFGKPLERAILVDDAVVNSIMPSVDVSAAIENRHQFILQRRKKVEGAKAALGRELTQRAKGAHWKIATRCAIFATNLCLRFDNVAPAEFVDLVAHGTNDPHPGLRGYYLSSFTALFTVIDMRAVYGHDYTNYLLEKEVGDRNRLEMPVTKGDAEFTQKFLEAFKDPEGAEYLVDFDHPGWLAWGKKFTAFRARPLPFDAYDEVETGVREHIGRIVTKEWISQCFEYFKQEPRDQSTDRFRMSYVYLLMHVFDLMHYGKTAVTLDDVKELTKGVYGDGSDKHQHRATSEILGALLAGSSDDPPEIRNRVWEFAAPMLLKIFTDDLTPENLQYWLTCLHVVLDAKDPRRSHEIVQRLQSFRLDMSSNAAFKESSKVQLVEFIVADGGWHFRDVKPILEHFVAHIDHPYKAVREAIGRLLSAIEKSRYHESFESVPKLLEENKKASSIGIRPYQPSAELTDTINDIFARLEKWRHERTPGQQTPSSYTSGSKTVLMWLDCTMSSHECIELVPFFATPFMEQLLHMMDVKEDPELMKLAYHVYRHLPNIPLRSGEDTEFSEGLIRIGRTAASWHQRLRALVNMQVIYFRRIFLMKAPQRDALFTAVSDMLSDSQLEVRSCASTTLAGMIRCSPRQIRDPMVARLKERFEGELQQNPMPRRGRNAPGTETPVDVHKQITRRHAAILGLGALIEAFPYATPPPEWMPEVLATLARKASGDAGVVGKATKSILSEFKKTRQDSWNVDQKYFTQEQLEDLEGVLWKSYFA